MRIVVFSGTTEGRELSYLLARKGADVVVCVATEYGREEQREEAGVTVLTGRKNADEMAEILRGSDLCIDATHPYAVDATETIRAACTRAGVGYRRLLRSAGYDSGEDMVIVDSAAQAAEYLSGAEGNILLTTGAKQLSAFSNLEPERLYPRVLPTHESLSACEAVRIPHRNILAMQGPFSQELNEATIRQLNIKVLVTKDGGKAGGFTEKVAAAQNTGTLLVLIRRPDETGETFEEIVRSCEELMK